MLAQNGFTLMDGMITLAVICVLLSLGVPSASQFLGNQRLATLKHEMVSQLNLARHQAITESRTVNLCPSSDGYYCSDSEDWSDGWISYTDLDLNRQRSDEEPIHQVSGMHAWASISSGERSQIRFRFDGTAVGSNGSLRLCDERGPSYGWRLVISNVGRVRSVGPGIDHC